LRVSAESAEPAEGYLVRVRLDGSSVRPITKSPGHGALASDAAPAISPDGTTVAFHRSVAGRRGFPPFVYLVGLDGSRLRRLTGGAAPELDPAWSRDGRRIGFARQAGRHFDLFVCRPDGSQLRRLTQTPGADEDQPAWSPDGKHLAFARWASGFERGGADLWLADADGSGAKLLVGGTYDDNSPAWSLDGRRIAFTRDGHLAVMSADGSGIRRLTRGDRLKESRPTWSPDGSRIVFTRDPGTILLIDPDGSNLSRVPLDAPANDAVWEVVR
jgi:Tol biopolymer transport system component